MRSMFSGSRVGLRIVFLLLLCITVVVFWWNEFDAFPNEPAETQSRAGNNPISHSMLRSRANSTNSRHLIRNNDLSSLVDILNSQQTFFKTWDINSSDEVFSMKYTLFVSSLLPWVVGEPPAELLVKENPFKLRNHLNCADPKFSQVLSGQKLTESRVIVDFIPFGYDLDKLEIRLLENFESVDAFVIYESTLTQTGTKKSLLFQMVRDTPRFSRFKSKILYFYSTSLELRARLGNDWHWGPENWELENSMRSELLRRFQEISPSHEQYPLYSRIADATLRAVKRVNECIQEVSGTSTPSSSLSSTEPRVVEKIWDALSSSCKYSEEDDGKNPIALAIQNDGDEIPSGSVLYHLKHCELKKPDATVFLPIFSYKNSIELIHNEGSIPVPGSTPSHLDKYVPKGSAIHVAPLLKYMSFNNTFRGYGISKHMNLGSGVHLSSMADPVERWFKSISTQHAMQHIEMRTAIPSWFITAGREGHITADMVRNVTGMYDNCRSDNPNLVPVSSLSGEDREFLHKSLPWALRHNSRRYPFIIPPCGRN